MLINSSSAIWTSTENCEALPPEEVPALTTVFLLDNSPEKLQRWAATPTSSKVPTTATTHIAQETVRRKWWLPRFTSSILSPGRLAWGLACCLFFRSYASCWNLGICIIKQTTAASFIVRNRVSEKRRQRILTDWRVENFAVVTLIYTCVAVASKRACASGFTARLR
jgi:hypothetical protein